MRILFGADVSTKEDTNNYQHLANQDAEAAFSDVLPVLKSADAVVVNLECAITDSDHQIKKFGPEKQIINKTKKITYRIGEAIYK